MFTKEEFRKIDKMYGLFNELENILLSMSKETQEKILSYHNEEGSLQYCIKWGLQASEELLNEIHNKQFKVIDGGDNTVAILNEKQLRNLANYYYSNSDIIEPMDFEKLPLDKAIEFIERVDKVEPIE